MNIAICDDDELFCSNLLELLNNYFVKYHIKDTNILIFHSGEEILGSDESFDLAFMDVEMKGINGIHAGNELSKRNPRLIFIIITSYGQYLDEALHFNAFRYLTKPLDVERLYYNLKDALYLYSTLEKKVLIETKEMSYSITSSSIIMIEAIRREIIIHTCSGSFHTVQPLKYWLRELEGLPFLQTHRSYIVNLAHVLRFDESLIYLTADTRAYLTKRKYQDFKKHYLLYIGTVM